MTETEILIKTAAGTEEVKARSRKLAPRMRTVLIMADGLLNAGQLRRAAVTLGAPQDCVDFLIQQGLVAAVQHGRAAAAAEHAATPSPPPPLTDGERFRAGQKFMNDNVVDALGLRAFFFTLKIETCFTAADLLALLPDFNRLITKGSGDAVARVLDARAREILR